MSTINKNEYYINISTEKFLGGREILKSMPIFYNRVYFCRKYASVLWNENVDANDNRVFSDISMVCSEQDVKQLRQIIKNNFLYLSDWDSIKFVNNQDFGFSFIAGNIKYVVMVYNETVDGYLVKSYDVNTGECATTEIKGNKQFFLDTSINASGEVVRTCAFDPDDMNDTNTTKKLADVKAANQTAIYGNRGSALASVELILLIMICSLVIVWGVYLMSRFFLA